MVRGEMFVEGMASVGTANIFVSKGGENKLRVMVVDQKTGIGAFGFCEWRDAQQVDLKESERIVRSFHHLVGILATGIFQPGQDFLRGLVGIVVFQAEPMGNVSGPSIPN